MLKMVNYTFGKPSRLEVDFYVPLKMRFIKYSKQFINLCMISDGRSLFEISVERDTGLLYELTLLVMDKRELSNDELKIKKEIILGVPIFKKSLWRNKNMVDLKERLSMIIGKKYAKISIGKTQAEKYYSCGQAYLGIDVNDKLCEVCFEGLYDEQIQTLKDSFEHKDKSKVKAAI